MAYYRKGVLVPDEPRCNVYRDRPSDHNKQFHSLKAEANPIHIYVVDVAAFLFGLEQYHEEVFRGTYDELHGVQSAQVRSAQKRREPIGPDQGRAKSLDANSDAANPFGG
jgi:hypothetical protein